MLREVKPKNARTARILKSRLPQTHESRKRTLLLHGPKCPLALHTVLKTISSLTRPHSVLLTKKNEKIHPFENCGSLEFLADKNGCGIVVFGGSSKKRPNCVTILRVFGDGGEGEKGRVLDMIELLLITPGKKGGEEGGEENENGNGRSANSLLPISVETRPLLLFAGSIWADTSSSPDAQLYATLKSLLLDIFGGYEATSPSAAIDIAGLQYLLMVAAGEPANTTTGPSAADAQNRPVVHLRWYKISTHRSGQKLPRIELTEVAGGQGFDFRVGRSQLADEARWKEAMRKARRVDAGGEMRNGKKNIGTDRMGDQIGKVHLAKQDLGGLQGRKMKGLKRRGGESDEDDEEAEMGIEGDEGMGDGVDDMDVDGEDFEVEMRGKRMKLG